jgi:hypothetical protein
MGVDETREQELCWSECSTWSGFEGRIFLVDVGERFDRIVQEGDCSIFKNAKTGQGEDFEF